MGRPRAGQPAARPFSRCAQPLSGTRTFLPLSSPSRTCQLRVLPVDQGSTPAVAPPASFSPSWDCPHKDPTQAGTDLARLLLFSDSPEVPKPSPRAQPGRGKPCRAWAVASLGPPCWLGSRPHPWPRPPLQAGRPSPRSTALRAVATSSVRPSWPSWPSWWTVASPSPGSPLQTPLGPTLASGSSISLSPFPALEMQRRGPHHEDRARGREPRPLPERF